MNKALLGVDIGTTNLKAVAFSVEGKQLAKTAVATPTDYPQADWAEFNHETLWDSLVDVIRGAIDQLPNGTEISSIAFTGMAEAGLPLDQNDTPLYPAITWFDRRALTQMHEWQEDIGEKKTAEITGLPIAPAAGILRPLWLRDNEPEIFAQTKTWLNLPDYAAFKLCGAKVTEYSLASRMMLLDLDTKEWSSELLGHVGLSPDWFGQLAPSAVQIGTVSKEAAALTGLPIDLPVCTAGHDHLCAAVGLGVTAQDDIFDSIGTAEAMVASLPKVTNKSNLAMAGIAQGIHVLPDTYYAISGNSFGGGSIDWSRRLLLSTVQDKRLAYEELIALAEQVPAGSGGVFFLPHLRQANPPVLDPLSRGAFIGLSSDIGPGHLARAVLEGLAFEYQRILDTMTAHYGKSSQRIVVAGGGTQNKLFMQIKADVSGLPIIVPDVEEATCLGAAVAAGIGAGVYQDYENATKQINFSHAIIEPDLSKHDFYQERYQKVYLNLYDSLKNINHQISDWVRSDNGGVN